MPSEWCCPPFRERFFQTDGRRDGLGILWFVRSRTAPVFGLEYRRPNQESPERIAEDGIKIEFCLGVVATYLSITSLVCHHFIPRVQSNLDSARETGVIAESDLLGHLILMWP